MAIFLDSHLSGSTQTTGSFGSVFVGNINNGKSLSIGDNTRGNHKIYDNQGYLRFDSSIWLGNGYIYVGSTLNLDAGANDIRLGSSSGGANTVHFKTDGSTDGTTITKNHITASGNFSSSLASTASFGEGHFVGQHVGVGIKNTSGNTLYVNSVGNGQSARFATDNVLNYIHITNSGGANHFIQTNQHSLALNADGNNTRGSIQLMTGNVTALNVDSSQNITFPVATKISGSASSTGSFGALQIPGGNNFGIGLHIHDGGVNATTPNPNPSAQGLVIESTSNTGMTIASGDAGVRSGIIAFTANGVGHLEGVFRYSHVYRRFEFDTKDVTSFTMGGGASGILSGSSTSTGSFGFVRAVNDVAGKRIVAYSNYGGAGFETSLKDNQLLFGYNGDEDAYGVMAMGSQTIDIKSNTGANPILRLHKSDGTIEAFSGDISGSSTSTGSFGRLVASYDDGLHIGNTIKTYYELSGWGLRIQRAAATGYAIKLFPGSGASYAFMDLLGGVGIFKLDGTEKFRLDSTGINVKSGNVSGSSTSTGSFGSLVVADAVQGDLEIKGNVYINNVGSGGGLDLDAGQLITGQKTANGGTAFTFLKMYDPGDASIQLGSKHPLGYISFQVGNGAFTERMRIKNNGNVGINNNSPTEKLVVGGVISGSSGLHSGGNIRLGPNSYIQGYYQNNYIYLRNFIKFSHKVEFFVGSDGNNYNWFNYSNTTTPQMFLTTGNNANSTSAVLTISGSIVTTGFGNITTSATGTGSFGTLSSTQRLTLDVPAGSPAAGGSTTRGLIDINQPGQSGGDAYLMSYNNANSDFYMMSDQGRMKFYASPSPAYDGTGQTAFTFHGNMDDDGNYLAIGNSNFSTIGLIVGPNRISGSSASTGSFGMLAIQNSTISSEGNIIYFKPDGITSRMSLSSNGPSVANIYTPSVLAAGGDSLSLLASGVSINIAADYDSNYGNVDIYPTGKNIGVAKTVRFNPDKSFFYKPIDITGDLAAFDDTDLSVNAGLTITNTANANNEGAGLFFKLHNTNGQDKGAGIIVKRSSNTQSNIHFVASTSSTPATKMVIEGSGNVGIGTSTPSQIFHVRGTNTNTPDLFAIRNTGSEVRIGIGTVNPSSAIDFSTSLPNGGGTILNTFRTEYINNIRVGSHNGRLVLQSNNGIRIGAYNNNPSGNVYGLEVKHTRDSSNTGDKILNVMKSDDTSAMVVKPSGAMGINTNSPAQKLDIRGSSSNGTMIQLRDTGDDYPVGVTYNHAVSGHHYSWYAGTMDGGGGERKFTIGTKVVDGFHNDLTTSAYSLLTLSQIDSSATFAGNLNANGNIVGDGATDITGIDDIRLQTLRIGQVNAFSESGGIVKFNTGEDSVGIDIKGFDASTRILMGSDEVLQMSGSVSIKDSVTMTSGLRLGDTANTHDNWISIRVQDGGETDGSGITWYETGTFSVSSPQYGAKIVYDEDNDKFLIGTMHAGNFRKQIQMARASARIEVLGEVRPVTDNLYDLGSSSKRWDDVRATNGTIQTSDRNLKTQISGSDLGLDFINDLNPVKYQWVSGSRPHYGLIAQEVSSSLAKSSVHTDNFAGYIENRMFISGSVSGSEKDIRNTDDWEMENFTAIPNPELSLRYNEFISPMMKAIQELSSQVETLKAQISSSSDFNALKTTLTDNE